MYPLLCLYNSPLPFFLYSSPLVEYREEESGSSCLFGIRVSGRGLTPVTCLWRLDLFILEFSLMAFVSPRE